VLLKQLLAMLTGSKEQEESFHDVMADMGYMKHRPAVDG
jgi:hypothetical protein